MIIGADFAYHNDKSIEWPKVCPACGYEDEEDWTGEPCFKCKAHPLMWQIEQLKKASPDDIRDQGWAVAVHNDYNTGGERHTFWGFTKGSQWVRGEGKSDGEALEEVRKAIWTLENDRDPDWASERD